MNECIYGEFNEVKICESYDSYRCEISLTIFNKIAIQARAQMAADKEAVRVGYSRVHMYDNIYPAVKNYLPPVTLPSVLSAVCIAQN